MRLLVVLAVAAIPFVVSIPKAFAGVGLGVIPNFPNALTLGQTNVAASVTVTNLSNGVETNGNVTLSAVTVVLSCGTFTATTDCPASGADAGVFRVDAGTIGRTGTACAGIGFAVTLANSSTGQLAFTPSSPVVLGRPSGTTPSCVIDLTFDVLKVPVKDVSAATGVQTEQIAAAVGFHDDGTPGSGTGTSLVTVTETTPPKCFLTGVIRGPPLQVQAIVQDTGSGLAANGITATMLANATLSIPSFAAGTTSPVVVTFTKIDPSRTARFALQATDRSGNVATCDPTGISIDRSTGEPVTQTADTVSSTEHLLTVFNGWPGIRTLVVSANGHVVVLRLTDGQILTIDVAKVLKPGDENNLRFIAAGVPGSTATAVLHN